MRRFGSSWYLIVGFLIFCGLPSCKDEGSGIECCTCKCYEPNIAGCDVEEESYLPVIGEDLECEDVCAVECARQWACDLRGSWECTEEEKKALGINEEE